MDLLASRRGTLVGVNGTGLEEQQNRDDADGQGAVSAEANLSLGMEAFEPSTETRRHVS